MLAKQRANGIAIGEAGKSRCLRKGIIWHLAFRLPVVAKIEVFNPIKCDFSRLISKVNETLVSLYLQAIYGYCSNLWRVLYC